MPNKINLDEIRRKIDIVQVISAEGITLTKKGKNFVGICPFHDDTNPSMTVSPEKQIFKCFVCGTAGNVFTFIRDYEKIPFMAAVKKACDLAGIKVPELEAENRAPVTEHQGLYDTLAEVRKFYSYNLKISSGETAMKYLAGRQLDDSIIEKFQIGYCVPDGAASVTYLQGKQHNLDDIIYSGIGFQRDGEVYDRMAGRITFAIHDEYGRVVGFSGRRIDEQQDPKYLNTPETALFHKGSLLYNYYNCDRVCRRIGIVYLVEGFMDAIALSRAGIDNVVATMGTALTSEHRKLLQKLNCQIHLMFDSDDAGQNAAFRSIEVLKDLPKGVKIVNRFNLADAKDIDEVLDKYGKEKLQELINQTSSVTDFQIDYLYSRVNPNNYDDRKLFVLQATKLLGDLRDDIDIEHYVGIIATKSGFNTGLVRKLAPQKESANYIPEVGYGGRIVSNRQTKLLNRYEQAEHQILNKLLKDKFAPVQYLEENTQLYSDVNRRLAFLILDFYNIHGDVDLADLMSTLPPELSKVVGTLSDETPLPSTMKELCHIIREDLPKKLEIKKNKEELSEISDPQQQAEYAKEHLLKEGVLYRGSIKSKKKE